jgi:hypothetical protein
MSGIETQDKCPKCGAATYWRLSVEGTRLRLDAKPDPAGTVIILTLTDGTIRAKCLTGSELPAQQEAWRLHACARRYGPPDPNCVVCGRRMPRDIADELGWVTHPGCDQEYQAAAARHRAGTRRRTG